MIKYKTPLNQPVNPHNNKAKKHPVKTVCAQKL